MGEAEFDGEEGGSWLGGLSSGFWVGLGSEVAAMLLMAWEATVDSNSRASLLLDWCTGGVAGGSAGGVWIGEVEAARLEACTMVCERHCQNSENLPIASLLGDPCCDIARCLDIVPRSCSRLGRMEWTFSRGSENVPSNWKTMGFVTGTCAANVSSNWKTMRLLL